MAYNDFQNSLHNLLSWFLDPRSLVLDLEGEHRPLELAHHIASGYRILLVDSEKTESIVKNPPLISSSYFEKDYEYRQPIQVLYHLINSDFKDYITHFFLHGSLATEDYKKGWSDLDTLMVVKKEVVFDGEKLLKLRNQCLKTWPLFTAVTPLQHHGFIVITELDLFSYPQRYLPPTVLDQSLGMKVNQPSIEFKAMENNFLTFCALSSRLRYLEEGVATGVFKHHPHKGVYLSAKFKNADNAMRQLFALLGYIMTVPAYFLSSIGRGVPKKESFTVAKPYFSPAAWGVLEKAGQVRDLWEEKAGQGYQGNAVPVWVQKIMGKNFLQECLILVKEAVNKADSIIKG